MLSKSLLVGTALLAFGGGALASDDKYTKVYGDGAPGASCKIISSTKARSQSAKVSAVAIHKTNDYLCKGHDHPDDDWHYAMDTGSDWAEAYARAIADVTVDCYASGKGASYKVNGRSYAYTQATAIAKAFALAMSNAQTCGKCKTAGKVFASSVESILLQASVYVEVDIEGNARDGDVEDYYTVVARDIKKVTIEAFAHAISTARARDGKCTGSGYISVGAGEEDDLNTATCTYDVKATERKVVKDAIAVAVGGAALSVCDTEFSIPKYRIEAEATAYAMAVAMSQVSGTCVTSDENSYACIRTEAEITATARAIAVSIAAGIAKSTNHCYHKCSFKEADLSVKLAHVLATAYKRVRGNKCTSPDELVVTVDKMKEDMKTMASTAIAKVIVEASYDSYNGCKASVKPTTEVTTPEHVEPIHPHGGQTPHKGNDKRVSSGNMTKKSQRQNKAHRKMKGKNANTGKIRGKKSMRDNRRRNKNTKATVRASGKAFHKRNVRGAVGGISVSKTVRRH